MRRLPCQRFIAIGDPPKNVIKPAKLTSDPRTVVISRPAKPRALRDAVELAPTTPSAANHTKSPPPPAEVIPRLYDECPLKTTMICDDNLVNRTVFLRVMERLGYLKPDLAVDGLDAVERCRTKECVVATWQSPQELTSLCSFDLILMDSESVARLASALFAQLTG